MSGDRTDILVIGAGQAGLSVSYHLSRAGREHLVVDRGGIGHAWREHRWDSFCLVTPNWTVNLPGRPYEGSDPDGFMPRDEFADYLRDWAESFGAPVRAGVDVRRLAGGDGAFRAETADGGAIEAGKVVVATATYQRPRTPPAAKDLPEEVAQVHAENYKNPGALPEGAVLVVGSGQTGCQIVEDLLRAGRKVYLAVGRSGRLPRRYRGRDCLHWQREMRLLERTPDMLDSPDDRFKGDPHVSGRDGGATINLRSFASRGCVLTGRLAGVSGGTARFDGDLAENLRLADEYAEAFLKMVDDHVRENGIDAPAESRVELEEHGVLSSAELVAAEAASPGSLDFGRDAVSTVIWATGFGFDFSWIEGVETDGSGYPVTEDGESPIPGLLFCGLNWMRKRKSGILYGVGEDAEIVASKLL